MGRCHDCGQELIEIDNEGERLTGCSTCNLWAPAEGDRWVRLSEEDLPARCTSYDMAARNRAPAEASALATVRGV
jgi:hypothetical protein